MSKSENQLRKIIGDMNNRGRLSVWSIVITVFGDAIVPRGGVISLSSLQQIMGRLGVEPNALRTALSRLASDGWIVRIKHGRQSSYVLAAEGADLFASATQRIYSDRSGNWSGQFEMALELSSQNSQELEKEMRALGFGMPTQGVFIRPDMGGAKSKLPKGAIYFTAQEFTQSDFKKIALAAWPMEELAGQYLSLLDRYSPFLDALRIENSLQPIDCLAARILLIHDWRRIRLKDPNLPSEMLDADWNGKAARSLVSELYSLLLEESEDYLSSCHASPDVILPLAEKKIYERFAS